MMSRYESILMAFEAAGIEYYTNEDKYGKTITLTDAAEGDAYVLFFDQDGRFVRQSRP